MIIEYTFENLGEVGIMKDTTPENIPQNAWSSGKNVRFREGTAQKFTGHDEVFGATGASAGPIFAIDVPKENDLFWMYAEQDAIYGTDGSSHVDMSSGTYAATLDINWNGGVLAGGVCVLNNGVDAPQQWTGLSLSTPFTDLANWPTGMIARVLKPLRQFLVAADIDDGTGRDGTLLRWSHPAAVGNVPSTWDYTDSTKSAGRTTITDGGNYILDMAMLRESMMIYKTDQMHSMTWTGGRSVFSFKKVFDFGLLTRRCAKEFFGKHFCVTNSDVVIHDGFTPQSILSRRWQSYLFNAIDSTYYERVFVAINHRKNEIWICYPEAGYSLPNMAVVWNWKDNTVGERELPPDTAHAEWGVIDASTGTSFTDLSGSYEDQTGAFDDQSYSGAKQGLLLCSYSNNRFYRADQTFQYDGANIDCYLQREFLPLGGVTNGRLQYEPMKIKTVYEIWPIFNAEAGTQITISIGGRFNESDSVTWEDRTFTVGTDESVKFRTTGRIIDIKFATTTNTQWELVRYKIRYDLSGGSR